MMEIIPIFYRQKESYLDVWVQLHMEETKRIALNAKMSVEKCFLVFSHSVYLMFESLYFEFQLLTFIVNIFVE